MIEYINQHPSGFWIALGFLMLAADALLFGFSTLVLLFGGIAALATGLLMNFALLPPSWVAGISAFGISTALCSALLWKPFKALQNRGGEEARSRSDLEGLEFRLQQAIAPGRPGRHRYSGIDWRVELDDGCGERELEAGRKVRVVAVDVGRFRVCPRE